MAVLNVQRTSLEILWQVEHVLSVKGSHLLVTSGRLTCDKATFELVSPMPHCCVVFIYFGIVLY